MDILKSLLAPWPRSRDRAECLCGPQRNALIFSSSSPQCRTCPSRYQHVSSTHRQPAIIFCRFPSSLSLLVFSLFLSLIYFIGAYLFIESIEEDHETIQWKPSECQRRRCHVQWSTRWAAEDAQRLGQRWFRNQYEFDIVCQWGLSEQWAKYLVILVESQFERSNYHQSECSQWTGHSTWSLLQYSSSSNWFGDLWSTRKRREKQATVALDQSTFCLSFQVTSSELVQEIHQVLMDKEETCHRTCFSLQLDGVILDNFTELKNIEGLKEGSLLKVVEGTHCVSPKSSSRTNDWFRFRTIHRARSTHSRSSCQRADSFMRSGWCLQRCQWLFAVHGQRHYQWRCLVNTDDGCWWEIASDKDRWDLFLLF